MSFSSLASDIKRMVLHPGQVLSQRRSVSPKSFHLREIQKLWSACGDFQEKKEILDSLVFMFHVNERYACSPKNLMKFALQLTLHLPDNMLAREINAVVAVRKAEILRSKFPLQYPTVPIESLLISSNPFDMITLEIGKAYRFDGRWYRLTENSDGLVLKLLNEGGGELRIPLDMSIKWTSFLPGDVPTSRYRLGVTFDEQRNQRVEVARLGETFEITGQTPGWVAALALQPDGSLEPTVQYDYEPDINERQTQRMDSIVEEDREWQAIPQAMRRDAVSQVEMFVGNFYTSLSSEAQASLEKLIGTEEPAEFILRNVDDLERMLVQSNPVLQIYFDRIRQTWIDLRVDSIQQTWIPEEADQQKAA